MSWAGPLFFHMKGRADDGPRLGPALQISIWWYAARPSRSTFHRMCRSPARPIMFSFFRGLSRGSAQPIAFSKIHGPARPMALAARPMRHGLYTGRATRRPMCYPVLIGEGMRADVFFVVSFVLRTFSF